MIQNKKKMFRLSNTARKLFWVARIFDATLPNFTNGRAIAPPAPLSPTPMSTHPYKPSYPLQGSSGGPKPTQ